MQFLCPCGTETKAKHEHGPAQDAPSAVDLYMPVPQATKKTMGLCCAQTKGAPISMVQAALPEQAPAVR